jgi:uncharacterized lipoprotein YehR (DUF1307 family)
MSLLIVIVLALVLSVSIIACKSSRIQENDQDKLSY